MFFRKRNRKRIFWILLLLLAIIFWRGLRTTTKADFDCSYKLVYAFCTPTTANAAAPSFFDILEAGVKF